MMETSSTLPQKSSAIFGNLRKSSGTLLWHNFWIIFVNLRKMGENPRKIVEKVVVMQCFYLINKIIHDCLWIWNISSRVQLYISLIRCAHSWNIQLNTRSRIPYLRAPMYYPLFTTNLNRSHVKAGASVRA